MGKPDRYKTEWKQMIESPVFQMWKQWNEKRRKDSVFPWLENESAILTIRYYQGINEGYKRIFNNSIKEFGNYLDKNKTE